MLQQLVTSLEGQLAAAKAGQLAAEQRAAQQRVATEHAAAELQQHRDPEEDSALQQVGTVIRNNQEETGGRTDIGTVRNCCGDD